MMSPETITYIIRQLEQHGVNDTTTQTLRQRFPEHHFTLCSDDDMDMAVPAQQCRGFNLYLVSTANHCATLTQDPEQASGLVIAFTVTEYQS